MENTQKNRNIQKKYAKIYKKTIQKISSFGESGNWQCKLNLKLEVKACVRYFLTNFLYHEMVALHKLSKMFFISSKQLFSFLRYLIFCVSIFPSFSPCQPLL